MTSDRLNAIILSLLAISLWASAPVLIKYALNHARISDILTLRYAFSCIVSAPFIFTILSKGRTAVAKLTFITLFVAAHLLSQTYSLNYVSAIAYGTIFALSPAASLFLINRELNNLALYGIMTIGALLCIAPAIVPGEDLSINGILLAIISTFAWVYYVKGIASLQYAKFSSWEITAANNVMMLVATVLVYHQSPFSLNLPTNYSALLAIAVLATSAPIGFVLFAKALTLSPPIAISSQSVEIALTALMAAVLLGEPLGFTTLLGLAIVSICLFLIYRKRSGEA